MFYAINPSFASHTILRLQGTTAKTPRRERQPQDTTADVAAPATAATLARPPAGQQRARARAYNRLLTASQPATWKNE